MGIEHDGVRESSESCFRLNLNGWSLLFGEVRGNSWTRSARLKTSSLLPYLTISREARFDPNE